MFSGFDFFSPNKGKTPLLAVESPAVLWIPPLAFASYHRRLVSPGPNKNASRLN
jgi:hypothetical protein